MGSAHPTCLFRKALRRTGHDHAKEEKADAHAGHDHGDHAGEHDPHIWLDPQNAAAMTRAIAAALVDIDPDNASTYQANAEAAVTELAALEADLTQTLAPAKDQGFMVLHDAYQYFDVRFGLAYEGSILDVAGASPGPQSLADTQAHLAEHSVRCILTEPQLSSALVETVIEGQDVSISQIDPVPWRRGSRALR